MVQDITKQLGVSMREEDRRSLTEDEPSNRDTKRKLPDLFQDTGYCQKQSQVYISERIYSSEVKDSTLLPHLTTEDGVNFAKYFDYKYRSTSSVLSVLKFDLYSKVEFLNITTDTVVSVTSDKICTDYNIWTVSIWIVC